MITCLGLVVGAVTSTDKQDVLNHCARFCKKYKHLLKVGIEFKINNIVYCTIIDTHTENDNIMILCQMYDNTIGIGISE